MIMVIINIIGRPRANADTATEAGRGWEIRAIINNNLRKNSFRCVRVVWDSRPRKQLSPGSRLKDSRLFSACEAQ